MTRPVIEILAGELPAAVDAAENALLAAGEPIFARGELLVRAVPAPNTAGPVQRPEGALILTNVGATGLQDDLERVANFQRWVTDRAGEAKPRRTGAPAQVAHALLARVGRWRFPQLRGIARSPFMRADGSVCVKSGYDANSGLLVAISDDWLSIPDRPTKADAAAALADLRALITTFPFNNGEDEAVVIAAMLTPLIRASLSTAPAFGFSAPVRGSGKSKLADIVATIATGSPAACMTWSTDDNENAKAVASAMLAGDPVLVIDNVETPLRGALLCSALTQSTLQLRPLGRSELVTVPSCATLIATGNQLTPAGDLTRRILVAELDPRVERPELREFRNDPVADALANRRDLVRAALVILSAGIHANIRRAAPLGSFESWCRFVRDPLIWLGMPDCVTVMERTYDTDPEREAAAAVLDAWRGVYGKEAATAADAARRAARADDPRNMPTRDERDLADALQDVAARPGGYNTKALGRWLQRHAGRVIDGYKLQRAGGCAKRGLRWQVVKHSNEDGVSGVSGVFSNPSRETEGVSSSA